MLFLAFPRALQSLAVSYNYTLPDSILFTKESRCGLNWGV